MVFFYCPAEHKRANARNAECRMHNAECKMKVFASQMIRIVRKADTIIQHSTFSICLAFYPSYNIVGAYQLTARRLVWQSPGFVAVHSMVFSTNRCGATCWGNPVLSLPTARLRRSPTPATRFPPCTCHRQGSLPPTFKSSPQATHSFCIMHYAFCICLAQQSCAKQKFTLCRWQGQQWPGPNILPPAAPPAGCCRLSPSQ